MSNKYEKLEAVAKHLKVDPDDLVEAPLKDYGLTVFELGCEVYTISTDEEADRAAADYIKDSLWSFSATFIIEYTPLPWEAVDMIKAFQKELCESANDTIEALITNMDDFIEAAISADGRGHFLASYDFEEHEQDGFFIYGVN